jgi:hypothetical protein
MIMRIFTLAVAASLFAIIFIVTASAVVKKAGPPAPAAAKTNRMMPLTEGECRGLGGDVVTTHGCDTGLACQTADKDGVLRRACIDNRKN